MNMQTNLSDTPKKTHSPEDLSDALQAAMTVFRESGTLKARVDLPEFSDLQDVMRMCRRLQRIGFTTKISQSTESVLPIVTHEHYADIHLQWSGDHRHVEVRIIERVPDGEIRAA